MGRAAIRNIILLAFISLAGIIATQIFWVKKAIDLKEQQFNHRAYVALKSVADRLIQDSKFKVQLDGINKKASNYYTIDFSSPVNVTMLENYLIIESKNQNLNADFEYGIFECTTDSFYYGRYVSIKNTGKVERLHVKAKPSENYYVGVLFPKKRTYLQDDLKLLIFFSIVLLVVIGFFTYTILVILKQKKLSEIKTDFVNNMTHEFKTPISTIALSSDVLMRDDIIKNPERLKHYATIISEENKRLKSQVESVLQVSQIDSHKIALNVTDIDMHALIENIAKNMEPRVSELHGKIILQLNAKKVIVSGDEVHLTNILYNLLDNAIKYCDKIPEIQIITLNKHKGIEISVKDNGKGIETSSQNMIFEKFFRVPSGNLHDVKGFGLGLFYVKNMIKLHRGKIALHSIPKVGTTFTIWFHTKEK
ncbi:MAG TPA: HAMP domain-containing sensor histidine kinase [Chitinophagales bacterium]|nr:HAMP domain-containing sensor histidine kinase [Chitinophagales bacterium]